MDSGHHHAREPAGGTAVQRRRRRHWKEKKSGFAVSGLVIERHRDGQTTSGGRGGGGGVLGLSHYSSRKGGAGGVTHTFLPCRNRDPPGSPRPRWALPASSPPVPAGLMDFAVFSVEVRVLLRAEVWLLVTVLTTVESGTSPSCSEPLLSISNAFVQY